METSILKKLAIMQEEGNDFFIIFDELDSDNDKAYEGTEQEALEQYDKLTPETKEICTFAEYCNDNLTEVEEYEESNGDWLVCDDSEADELWEQSLDNYIDEIITPELPETYRYYFDNEAWKEDARMDGRGHSLNTYDGNEYEQTIEGETFYLYKR